MSKQSFSLQTDDEVFHLDMQSSTSEFEDFIYLISHDVRNSVRALIELPQWIEEDLEEAGIAISGSVSQSIEMMNTHTGRLDRMLVDLLAFSRVGRMQEDGEVAVDVALTEMLEDMRMPSGFTLHTDLESNTLALGERDIFTLLTQLVSNALKHHDRNSGKVKISLVEEDGYSVLRVCDDGPGIPPEYRSRVFSALSTLRPRDEVEGSGMGLAIVRKIAQHYSGRISVCGGLDGRGTTIEVAFPIQSANRVPTACVS